MELFSASISSLSAGSARRTSSSQLDAPHIDTECCLFAVFVFLHALSPRKKTERRDNMCSECDRLITGHPTRVVGHLQFRRREAAAQALPSSQPCWRAILVRTQGAGA